jgi:DNA-binding protein HU-beta
MNKQELVKEISTKANLTQKQATDALNAFTEVVMNSLKKGDKVSLQGFGSWDIKERAERIGRNPRTGKEIKIAATKVAKFNASSNLKELVASKKKK